MGLIPREAFVKAKAQSILRKYKINKPPVPIYRIVNSEGIKVMYFIDEPEYGDGKILTDESGRLCIYLSISGCEKQDNWNLAVKYGYVALGHLNLPEGAMSEEEKANEARIFAEEILAPDFLLSEYVGEPPERLSEIFSMPLDAAERRFKEIWRILRFFV